MTLISENHDVPDHLISYLIGIDWTYLPPDDVLLAREQELERWIMAA